MEKHGTAIWTPGQFVEVQVLFIRALHKALEGLGPKQVIKSLQNRGEEISRLLRKDLDTLITPVFSRDMREEGWKLVEDVSEPAEIVIADLELVPFLNGNEASILAPAMRQRAVELRANLGQRHAEYLFEHQEEIPEEFRKYHLVFPGTVWRDSGGLRVPYLRWRYGEGWILDFDFSLAYFSYERLVRPRK